MGTTARRREKSGKNEHRVVGYPPFHSSTIPSFRGLFPCTLHPTPYTLSFGTGRWSGTRVRRSRTHGKAATTRASEFSLHSPPRIARDGRQSGSHLLHGLCALAFSISHSSLCNLQFSLRDFPIIPFFQLSIIPGFSPAPSTLNPFVLTPCPLRCEELTPRYCPEPCALRNPHGSLYHAS
jgi:hypothetical protein